MAYLDFETRAAEKAELQDLLLRLQEAHVDADGLDVGAWYDPLVPDVVRDKYDAVRKNWYIYEEELAATCIRLLKADVLVVTDTFSEDFIAKNITFETFSETLQEDLRTFLSTLQTQTNRTDNPARVRKIANIWRHLQPLLVGYKEDKRTHADIKTSAAQGEINVLFQEMRVYSTFNKKQFNLANPK